MKTIKFEVGGKFHSMVIPDDDLSAVCAEDIINGKPYPFPDFFRTPAVVADLGGHAGEFSAMCRAIWPTSEVHCYEPNPALYPYLSENAAKFGFKVHPQGVGPNKTKMRLRKSLFGTVAYSFLEREQQTGESIEVLVVSISSVMELHPNVLKLDVEGFEYPLLCYAREYDRPGDPGWGLKDVEMLHVEYHTTEDRRRIDDLLIDSHDLWFARIQHKNQGELTYIRRKDEDTPVPQR